MERQNCSQWPQYRHVRACGDAHARGGGHRDDALDDAEGIFDESVGARLSS